MSATKVVVFGHSHVWSMRGAIGGLNLAPGQPVVSAPLCGTKEMPGPIVVRDARGKMQVTATLSALLAKLRAQPDVETTWLLSAVQGNYYNRVGMIATGGAFDTVLPFAPDLPLDDDAEIIPYAAVKDMMLVEMNEMKNFVGLMSKGDFATRTLIAGPPPPPVDDTFIRESLAKENVTDLPSAAHVRLKLWHLQNQISEEMCKGTPLVYLPGTPEGTQDSDDYLRPEFVKDAVHANRDWALRYLKMAVSEIARLEEKQHV